MGEGLTDRLVRALPAGLTPQRPTGGPDSITIMLLPPYSPELNPAERIGISCAPAWLSSRMFADLDGDRPPVSTPQPLHRLSTSNSAIVGYREGGRFDRQQLPARDLTADRECLR